MPEPVIMTLSEFKDATTPSTPWKRGRDMYLRLVDLSLGKFDSFRNKALVNDKKFHAFRIATNCDTWMTAKAGKTTTQASERRVVVRQLGSQAWNYLQYWEFAARKAAQPQGYGNLKGMSPGYTAERTLYVASGKTQMPISGSYMHAASEDPSAWAIIGNKTFSQLTPLDYKRLDDYLQGEVTMVDPMDPGGVAKTNLSRTVLFLDKDERIKTLILIRGGLMYQDFDKTLNTGNFACAYVIDKYGNLYASRDVFQPGLSFNHSTFNAGKDVICAGILYTNQGRLTSIQNNSGHYKPTRDHLHNAVLLLNNQDLDFTGAKIIVGAPDPGRPGKMIEHDYDNAQVFINNRNAAPTRSVPQP